MATPEHPASTVCQACDLGWELEERDGVWWHESPTGNVGWICRTRSPEAVPVRSAATITLEPDPAVPPGCACSECERAYGLSHLGTCSGSSLMGGSGIVGFRVKEASRV